LDELVPSLAILGESLSGHLVDHLHHQPRADGIGSVTDQDAHVVHLSRFSSLYHNGHIGSLLLSDEEMVNTAAGQQGSERDAFRRSGTVGKDDDSESGIDCI
jgi:hypothetical protein